MACQPAWVCHRCTLENDPHVGACAACNTPRASALTALVSSEGHPAQSGARAASPRRGDATPWSCSRCTLENSADAVFCAVCEAARAEGDGGWTCPRCTLRNAPAAANCEVCGEPVPAAARRAAPLRLPSGSLVTLEESPRDGCPLMSSSPGWHEDKEAIVGCAGAMDEEEATQPGLPPCLAATVDSDAGQASGRVNDSRIATCQNLKRDIEESPPSSNATPDLDRILAPGEKASVGDYAVKNCGNGVLTCTCPAWRFQKGVTVDRRSCKHLREFFGAAEVARVAAVNASKSTSASGDDAASTASRPSKRARTGASPPKVGASTCGGETDAAAGEFAGVLLAKKWEVGKVDPVGWLLSEKLDGMRAFWDGKRFLSRLGNEIRCPDRELLAELTPGFPLDGELFLGRGRFQDLMSVVKNSSSGPREWAAVRYIIFDAPAAPGGFEQRLAEAEKRLAGNARVVAHPHVVCESLEHLEREQRRVESLGGEGLMLRKPGSAYRAGRDSTLLKVKGFNDDEAIVVAHEQGKGKNAGVLGALRCRSRAGKLFNVGTGFSDAQRRNPPAVGEIITYRYQELTKDGIPRFPTYVGVRADADRVAFETGVGVSAASVSGATVARSANGSCCLSTVVGAAKPDGERAGVCNADLADVFEEMGVVHGIKGDRIRANAYAKAADALRRQPEAILSGAQAKSIPGIGAGMARRLDEVLETGELQELQTLKEDPAVIAVRELRCVYGVGPKFARELIEKHKIKSLQQLRAAVQSNSVPLNAAQQVGMRLAEELRVRIPRGEVAEIETALQAACTVLNKKGAEPRGLQATVCGSYRRGKAECGDVDVLITSEELRSDRASPRELQAATGSLLKSFISALRDTGLVTDDLALGPTKYSGVCKLPGQGRLHRRLDVRCFPFDQFFYGLVYFTGPWSLSIELRMLAIEKGQVLNEYRLASKDDPADRVIVKSEREVFEALGAPYREPWER